MTVLVFNAIILTISVGVMFNAGRIRKGKRLSIFRILEWLSALIIFFIYLNSILFITRYIQGEYAYKANSVLLKDYESEISKLNPYDKVIITESNINPATLLLSPISNDWFTVVYEENTAFVTLENPEVFQIDTKTSKSIIQTSYISDGSVCYEITCNPKDIPTGTVNICYAVDAMGSLVYNDDILYCYTNASIVNN